MTLKQVKKDLQDIRYYYTHKVMFDKAENTGFKSEAVRKSEEYGQIVSKAPPRLYVLYYLLYVEGKTQYAAAMEQSFHRQSHALHFRRAGLFLDHLFFLLRRFVFRF